MGATPLNALAATNQTPAIESLTPPFGMGIVEDQALFGSDQAVEPADPQVAAGPSSVLEMVNNTGTVWSKGGSMLAAADLNSLFAVPADYSFGQASLLYDSGTHRWFATGDALDAALDSQVYLAISPADDPTGAWQVRTINTSTSTMHISDSPKVSVTGDKILLTWDEFICTVDGCGINDAQLWILGKASALGSGQAIATYQTYTNAHSLLPAQLETQSNDGLVFFYDYAISVFEVSGFFPSVRIDRGGVCCDALPPAPGGQQPSGAAPLPTSGGTIRIASAIMRSATFAIVALEIGCFPPSGRGYHSCIDLVAATIDLTVSPAPVPQVSGTLLSIPDTDLYNPAVAMDAAGNLFLTANLSSATVFPSVVAFVGLAPISSASSNWTVIGPQTIGGGQGIYDSTPCGGGNAWGEYGAASPDPVDGTDVWMVGEYTPSASDTCRWGTAIGRVTIAAPTLMAAAPITGPPVGGTQVVITGTDFPAGGTTVAFGGVAATPIMPQTADRLIVRSPPHLSQPIPATVSLTLTTANGTVSTSFTYQARTEVSPSVIDASGTTRGTPPPSVAPCSCRAPASGATATDAGLMLAITHFLLRLLP